MPTEPKLETERFYSGQISVRPSDVKSDGNPFSILIKIRPTTHRFKIEFCAETENPNKNSTDLTRLNSSNGNNPLLAVNITSQ